MIKIAFGSHCFIDKVMLRQPIGKMKNGKIPGQSRLLAQIVNSSGES